MENKPQKIALVHDFLLTLGGAERVFLEMAAIYPDAPIYTLLADEKIIEKYFPGRIVRTSFLQKFPKWLRKRPRLLLPFYPVAVESLNLREFSVILSSSSAWSKGLVTRLHTKHVAYLHSPMRYVWDSQEEYLVKAKKKGFFLRGLLSYLRVWDFEAAQRPEVLLVNSRYTMTRTEKYYRRQAEIVYPPVTLNTQSPLPPEDHQEYFLLVSRLTSAKMVDVVVETFNKLGFPLLIVGEGKERKKLERQAEKNITFTGFVSDEKLSHLYREARALIFPSEEDFGLAAAESLSLGTPVIAFGYGGIQEIVIPGVTGEFFALRTPEGIAEAVLRFTKATGYDQQVMRESVSQFSRTNFREKIKRITESQI